MSPKRDDDGAVGLLGELAGFERECYGRRRGVRRDMPARSRSSFWARVRAARRSVMSVTGLAGETTGPTAIYFRRPSRPMTAR